MRRPSDHAGSVRSVSILGRPFPLRNAVYLGSLKSQLLIPAFAALGATVPVLRLSTLAIGLLGVLCAMLWARRLLGDSGAILAGVLLVADPSWLFFSLYEWGPFTSGLLCRSAGLLLVTAGWSERRSGALVAGALLLGLGVYNRADSALIVAAAALGLLVARPATLGEALGERRREAVLAAIALAGGALPMLISVQELFASGASSVFAERGGIGERFRVLVNVLDGSQFHRVLEVGGRFHLAGAVSAPWTPFGLLVLLSLGMLAVVALQRLRAGRPTGVEGFLVTSTLAVALGTALLPGAVRAHHHLNVLPFAHLLVAAAGLRLWRGGALLRVAAVAGVALVLVADAHAIARTWALAERTGGRGRWSSALHELAREAEQRGDVRVTSLDWGLHEPLVFLTRRPELSQPIWRMGDALRRRGEWSSLGRAGDLYLLHDETYDLFRIGPRFLREARRLESVAPDAVEIRTHRDRDGSTAFLSVRLLRDHRVVLRRSGFRIELE